MVRQAAGIFDCICRDLRGIYDYRRDLLTAGSVFGADPGHLADRHDHPRIKTTMTGVCVMAAAGIAAG